jgi:hypothetical protein
MSQRVTAAWRGHSGQNRDAYKIIAVVVQKIRDAMKLGESGKKPIDTRFPHQNRNDKRNYFRCDFRDRLRKKLMSYRTLIRPFQALFHKLCSNNAEIIIAKFQVRLFRALPLGGGTWHAAVRPTWHDLAWRGAYFRSKPCVW